MGYFASRPGLFDGNNALGHKIAVVYVGVMPAEIDGYFLQFRLYFWPYSA